MLNIIKYLMRNIKFWVIFVLLLLIAYLSFGIYVNSCLSRLTGTTVKADLSIFELLRGNLKFNKIVVYSDISFARGINAVKIYDLKINPDLFNLFRSKKIINSITTDKIELISYYANNDNNIADIIKKNNYYFALHPVKSQHEYLIRNVLLRNISLRTYYYSDSPVSAKLPDIRFKNLSLKGDLTRTVSDIFSISLAFELNKKEDKNIHWWEKGLHGIDAGLNITSQVLEALSGRQI